MSVQVEFPPVTFRPPVVITLEEPSDSSSSSLHSQQPRSLDSSLSATRRHSACMSGSQNMLNNGGSNSASNSNLILRRENLKLSFNRSISEPHCNGLNPPVLSPPSVAPSLHPSKRSRLDSSGVMPSHPAATTPVATTCFLRPPPLSIAPGSVSLPASPCSESSTLQRTLLMQKARTIEHHQLASKLEMRNNNRSSNFLLVDCRPFIAYNVNHIQGAINVNCCDRFNRKRLQQGKATLADLATTKEGKETLKKRTWKEVVVYDDASDSLDKLPVSHTLFLVMNALVEDQREPTMLLGGLRDFQVSHRSLCEDHLMHSRSAAPSNAFLPDLPSPSDLCHTKDIENHPASKVLPYLYLGNMRDAADHVALRGSGIKYVLNVTAKPPAYQMQKDIVYKQLHAADNGVQNLRQFFEEAFSFIDLARADRSGVLIHCHAGVSRSPTIAVAYLMKHYPMAMGDAYKFVKTRRSIISPNLNFMGQLYEYEQGLRATAAESEKEPLTAEMAALVKESLGGGGVPNRNSAAAIFGEQGDKGGLLHHQPGNGFRWSEEPKEEGVTSGCSV